ncbi:MAG: hypothetical protein ACTSR0_04595 [Candidatus Asgardarchaeia archaeon]
MVDVAHARNIKGFHIYGEFSFMFGDSIYDIVVSFMGKEVSRSLYEWLLWPCPMLLGRPLKGTLYVDFHPKRLIRRAL